MHPANRRISAAALALAAILTAACSNSTGPKSPPAITLEVKVSTAGTDADVDSDGYFLRLDGEPGKAVGVNGTVALGPLALGWHRLELYGLAATCRVDGDNPRTIEIISRATLVSFLVSCGDDGSGAGTWDY